MNSQIVLLRAALRSNIPFFLVAAFIPVSLFLKAGFISVGVIWFFALSLTAFKAYIVRAVQQHYLLLFPLSLFVFYAFGIALSEQTVAAVEITLRKIHLFLIPTAFLIANRRFSSNQFHTILLIFLISCVIASIVCYANAAVTIFENRSIHYSGGNGAYYFVGGPLIDILSITPIYLSIYFNLAFVIAFNSPLVKSRAIRWSVMAYLAVFIILIGSKTGIVILIVTLFINLFATRKGIVSCIILIISAVSVVFGIYRFGFFKTGSFPVKSLMLQKNEGVVWNNIDLRFTIWESAIDAIKKSPWIGYGPGDGQLELEKVYSERGFKAGLLYLNDPELPQYNAHNEFFSTWLDIGILGVVCLVTMLAGAVIYAVRKRDLLAICFVVIISLSFCVESLLLRQKGIVFFAFFFAFIFFFHSQADQSHPGKLNSEKP